ncbi:MAG: UTRA domain-containing protein [Cellvibrionales bacterium]|nr:UTRA domain-containing protein [Cellvibrionales bacterium]
MSMIYESLKAYFIALRNNKSIAESGRLPSERQLQQDFDSSRITIREALFRLESEGFIYRLKRKGWFLSPSRLLIDPAHKVNFIELAKAQNKLPKTELISARKIKAKHSVREALALAKGASVYHIVRRRSLDGRPVLVENIYLCADQFTGVLEHALEDSITLLQSNHFGLEAVSEDCRIKINTLGEFNAGLLEVNAAMPALSIDRIRKTKKGHPVDYNVELWLHGAVELNTSSVHI